MGSLLPFPNQVSPAPANDSSTNTPSRLRRVPTPAARTAFAQLLAGTDFQVLRRLAIKIANGAMDPDDLLQDALERSVRHFDSFTPGTNMKAWLSTIMQRIVIDECRKRSRRRHVSADDLAAPEPTEAEPAWSRHDLRDVQQAAEQLHEPLRTTFRLHLMEGQSYAAIAAAQGLPLATVGTRLRRARLRVRALLETGAGSGQGIVLRGDFSQGAPYSDKGSGDWLPPLPPPTPPAPRRTPPARKAMTATPPCWRRSPRGIAAAYSLG